MGDSSNEGFMAVAAVGLGVACALTNPTKQDHLNALSDNNAIAGGLVELASGFGAVSYHNYVVCSTLTITDGKIISVGVLKNVFPVNIDLRK
jgi:hypothetical protein